jgi:hypothetical protein
LVYNPDMYWLICAIKQSKLASFFEFSAKAHPLHFLLLESLSIRQVEFGFFLLQRIV